MIIQDATNLATAITYFIIELLPAIILIITIIYAIIQIFKK